MYARCPLRSKILVENKSRKLLRQLFIRFKQFQFLDVPRSWASLPTLDNSLVTDNGIFLFLRWQTITSQAKVFICIFLCLPRRFPLWPNCLTDIFNAPLGIVAICRYPWGRLALLYVSDIFRHFALPQLTISLPLLELVLTSKQFNIIICRWMKGITNYKHLSFWLWKRWKLTKFKPKKITWYRMLERCLCNVFAIFDVMLHLLFKHYMYKFVYTLSLVEQTQDRYLYIGKSGINYVNCAYFNVDL